MRLTRPLLLLALAALMAPRAAASRTSVWESNPPAAVLTSTSAAGLLAPLAPAGPLESIAAAVEPVEPLRFDLGDVVLVENLREDGFRIGLADVVEPPALRGPPLLDGDPHHAFELCDPENRIRGLDLLPPFGIGASPSLSLWPHQACGFSCREVASDSRYDPWGLVGLKRAADLVDESLKVGGRTARNAKFRGRPISIDDLRRETRLTEHKAKLWARLDERYPGLEVPYDSEAGVVYEKANHKVVHGEVSIGTFSGDRDKDIRAAWKRYGVEHPELSRDDVEALKDQFTMHHDNRNGRLLLVDSDVHRAYQHTGGNARARAGQLATSALAMVLPRAADAHSQGASVKDQAVAAGVDIAMSGVDGAKDVVDVGEAVARKTGQSAWDRLKAWLDRIGGSGEARTKDARDAMGE